MVARHIIGHSAAVSGTTTMRPAAMSISGTAASVNGTSSASPLLGLDLDHVARAEIVDRRHRAERRAVRRHRGKPDQVGVIERSSSSTGGSRSRET